ncbi:MAG: uncharacterized protein KVP18_003016 [Porospora cf. gigantea A]|uniref:uncharacterized protein n=1 Tax=Porospora cf. gigantea A TaxID=2853593 RepID=UPI0035594790|nr:MAG: hypothetical protein KVP18_003016 [Porospora cf. gigantea A]
MRLQCLVTVVLAADALVEDLQLADDTRKPFNLSPFDSVWSPCSDCSEFDGCLQFGRALKGKLLQKTRTPTVGECIKACDNCADCNGIKYFALVEKCYLMQSEGNSTANKWFASLMITCLEKPATT